MTDCSAGHPFDLMPLGQLVGNDELAFGIVGGFAEGGLEPAGQVLGPVFRVFSKILSRQLRVWSR